MSTETITYVGADQVERTAVLADTRVEGDYLVGIDQEPSPLARPGDKVLHFIRADRVRDRRPT